MLDYCLPCDVMNVTGKMTDDGMQKKESCNLRERGCQWHAKEGVM